MELIIALNTNLNMALDPGLVGGFDLHIEYDRSAGLITDAWFLDERSKVFWCPISVAWEMLSGKTDKTRAYLDALAEDARFWEAS